MTYDSRPDTYQHITEVRSLLLASATALMLRAHVHDMSKLSSPEVEVFDEYSPKLRELTYGSDEYKQALKEMGAALQHHYANNRHHPEHFDEGIAGMNLFDLLEMLCDWIAATMRHENGDIYRSIEQNAERFGYDDIFEQIFRNTVEAIEGVVSGEDETALA